MGHAPPNEIKPILAHTIILVQQKCASCHPAAVSHPKTLFACLSDFISDFPHKEILDPPLLNDVRNIFHVETETSHLSMR